MISRGDFWESGLEPTVFSGAAGLVTFTVDGLGLTDLRDFPGAGWIPLDST